MMSLKDYMNNPIGADDIEDISLLPLNFDDILKEEVKAPLLVRNIFAVEKVNVREQSLNEKLNAPQETVKPRKRKVREKRKNREMPQSSGFVLTSSPERSTSIGKSLKEKQREIELKMTGRFPTIVAPVFKFIKDN
eukprot:TRINITY_DN9552_c0_g3_i11.p1 TRINITY_DN9552_c0_g3~~TRINITY_DN9552_c0_g3_i11.p1  ORF type:complete len:136 (-),score=39.83 TRINITY_DN9552_c0_g3_i11:127-534(-)